MAGQVTGEAERDDDVGRATATKADVRQSGGGVAEERPSEAVLGKDQEVGRVARRPQGLEQTMRPP